ncbi:hypothetical protein [Profundibacter amoris]|uniref:Uncharacterized protein n=1 Tax=Profundibacter amoris TaxID=2171755 RepID=A0A347UGW3_9RHOB|nr:hypothetical protein [Profundibacter amoris]AXX98091.1 hypothetical protein BAR1_09190 [Profundibacter amoris]
MKPRFFKLGYFIWIIVPAGLWLTYQLIGLPHVIWSYSWVDQGQGSDPFARRYYTQCRFIGPYGQIERPANAGRCAWAHFFKEEPR